MDNEGKKMGLLQNKKLSRKIGNFEPVNAYEEEKNAHKTPPAAPEKSDPGKKMISINNSASLKISKSTKIELAALRSLTHTKFDYEMIQTLIDSYVKQMKPDDYKRFKLLIELQE